MAAQARSHQAAQAQFAKLCKSCGLWPQLSMASNEQHQYGGKNFPSIGLPDGAVLFKVISMRRMVKVSYIHRCHLYTFPFRTHKVNQKRTGTHILWIALEVNQILVTSLALQVHCQGQSH